MSEVIINNGLDEVSNLMSQKNFSTFEIQSDVAEAGSFTLEGKTLVGRRGRYIISALSHSQPGVRIYLGKEIATQDLVIVKEYYSFWWTASDIERIEAVLEQLDTIEFRSGGVQDFRLLTPQDVFASRQDQRCYLVLRPPQHPSQSLRTYLESQGKLSTIQVRAFLSQVLQTLWFLHGQMIDFANGESQKGTAHGNLSLDSVLMVMDSTARHAQFQVYLQDLELWEAVVRPVPQSVKCPLDDQKQQDLCALGRIAAQLLLGELSPSEDWNPIEDSSWGNIGDQPLKQFVQQLMGLEASISSSAKMARAHLLSLPKEIEPISVSEQVESPESIELGRADRPPLYFTLAFMLVVSGIILNLGLLWAKGAMFQAPKPNSNGTNQLK